MRYKSIIMLALTMGAAGCVDNNSATVSRDRAQSPQMNAGGAGPYDRDDRFKDAAGFPLPGYSNTIGPNQGNGK